MSGRGPANIVLRTTSQPIFPPWKGLPKGQALAAPVRRDSKEAGTLPAVRHTALQNM